MSNVTRFGPLPTIDRELATKAYVDNNATGNTFSRVVKKVDQIISNSTTLEDDDELVVALLANKTYAFYLAYDFLTTTVADIKLLFAIPAGASGAMGRILSSTDVQDITVAEAIAAVNTEMITCYSGKVVTAGTAGNMQLQWAQNTAQVFDTTVNQGALLAVWESLP